MSKGKQICSDFRKFHLLFSDDSLTVMSYAKWEEEFSKMLDYMELTYGLSNLQVVKYFHRIWG